MSRKLRIRARRRQRGRLKRSRLAECRQVVWRSQNHVDHIETAESERPFERSE